MPESLNWTTEDELAVVRHLYERKNVKALRAYLVAAYWRKWYGPGMEVEPAIVIFQVQDWVGELER